MKDRIWLSPPYIGEDEMWLLKQAMESNWISTVGPHIQLFEESIEIYLDSNVHAVALNSGTSALHLGLELLDVKWGDEVICQNLTFAASAFPICSLGAKPIFIDSESETWNISPELLEDAIKSRLENGIKPKAIVVVDLYGMPCKFDEILSISEKYEIPILEDAAEALGSQYKDKKCGTIGDLGVLSFNGNKIITTSGGGALVVKTEELKEKAIYLATQSKENKPFYEHKSIGYNFRMSNILASIGIGQMNNLQKFINKRRSNFENYKHSLEQLNVEFLTESNNSKSNHWLSTVLFEEEKIKEKIRTALVKNHIEARNIWNPMHKQPVFKNYLTFINGTSENLFERGLCLPSGFHLTEFEMDRICSVIKNNM